MASRSLTLLFVLSIIILLLSTFSYQFIRSEYKFSTEYTNDSKLYPDNGIKVKGTPFKLEVNPTSKTLYVADKYSKRITFIDESTNKIVKNISLENKNFLKDVRKGVDLRPSMSIDNVANLLYFTSTDSDSVYVLDGTDGTSISSYKVNGSPFDVFVNGQIIYVITNEIGNRNSLYNGTIYTLNGFFNGMESNYTLPDTFLVSVKYNPYTQLAYLLDMGGTVYEYRSHAESMMFPIPEPIPFSNGSLSQAIDMTINPLNNMLYFVDSDKNFTYAINTTNPDPKTKKIPIKMNSSPSAIDIDPKTNMIFVTNPDTDKVSVINGTTNKIVNEISVGRNPIDVVVDPISNIAYVSNMNSHTISIINGSSLKLMGGTNFRINPSGSGIIVCNKDVQIENKDTRYNLGDSITCEAKPSNGYIFSSWSSDLILKKIEPILSFWDYIYLQLFPKHDNDVAGNDSNINKNSVVNVTVSKFGTLTANFVAQTPLIPPEFLSTIFSFAVTTVLGSWLIPPFIRWIKSKTDVRKLNSYHKKISLKHNDGKIEEKDIIYLDNLKNSISDTYANGKLNKEQYDKLLDEISDKYKEILKHEIASLDKLSESDKEIELNKLKEKIDIIYDKGKLNKEQFTNLKKEISIIYAEIYRKKIDILNDLQKVDKEKELQSIKDEMDVAYSKEKITEMHYNLLHKKLSKYEK